MIKNNWKGNYVFFGETGRIRGNRLIKWQVWAI